jgi:hypothetical protein
MTMTLQVDAYQYLNQVDRVRAHTHPEVNRRIDEEMQGRLMLFSDQPAEIISRRIEELDREWDVERFLQIQAGVTALLGLWWGLRKNKAWFLLTAVNQYYLSQHAIQGWCPPAAMYRRFGVRTRREIDIERTALKAMRGDFRQVPEALGDVHARVSAALQAAIENNGYVRQQPSLTSGMIE